MLQHELGGRRAERLSAVAACHSGENAARRARVASYCSMAACTRETDAKYSPAADPALVRLDDLPEVGSVRGPEEQQLTAEYSATETCG